MKTGIKGAQKNTVWRTMTAAAAAPLWTSKICGCHDSHMCAHTIEATLLLWQLNQLLDILSFTTTKINIYFDKKDKMA